MCRELSTPIVPSMILALVLLSSPAVVLGPSLVLYLSFDNDLAGEATDHSMYGNNGAIRADPQRIAGQFGDALNFDTIDDEVVAASDETRNMQDQITIRAGVRPGARREIPDHSIWRHKGHSMFTLLKENDYV